MTTGEMLAYVAERETLANAATPGPWLAETLNIDRGCRAPPLTANSVRAPSPPGYRYDICLPMSVKDTQFIADAREAVPQLCAFVRELVATVGQHAAKAAVYDALAVKWLDSITEDPNTNPSLGGIPAKRPNGPSGGCRMRR